MSNRTHRPTDTTAQAHEPIDEASRFDELARWYDMAIAPAEWLIQRRRKELLAKAQGDVLEVGIGTGRTLPFYPPGCRVTGVDTSGKMLERACRRARWLGMAVDLRLMPAEQVDFAGGSFDTVVSSLVFCSVSDPQRALAELRRVLRPAGQLLMVEHVRPNSRLLGRLFDRLDAWWYRRSCHLARRTPDAVRTAGFSVVEEQRWLRGVFAIIRAKA
ncbi:MAG: class I SAM-dependent methyltransferase [Chloroflexota bacterium]